MAEILMLSGIGAFLLTPLWLELWTLWSTRRGRGGDSIGGRKGVQCGA